MDQLAVADSEMGVLARMLRKVELFSPLTVRQLEDVLPHVRLYAYGKGETVVKQGEPGDAFYIIYSGAVEVRVKKGFFSFPKTVAIFGPGGFFGEIALIERIPRTATVVCTEPTQVFCLIKADFQLILDENPAAAREMQRIVARRMFDANHK